MCPRARLLGHRSRYPAEVPIMGLMSSIPGTCTPDDGGDCPDISGNTDAYITVGDAFEACGNLVATEAPRTFDAEVASAELPFTIADDGTVSVSGATGLGEEIDRSGGVIGSDSAGVTLTFDETCTIDGASFEASFFNEGSDCDATQG